jgi:hypothetical protein
VLLLPVSLVCARHKGGGVKQKGCEAQHSLPFILSRKMELYLNYPFMSSWINAYLIKRRATFTFLWISECNVLVLSVCCKLINFVFQVFPLFLKGMLASGFILLRLYRFVWYESCNHCHLVCFLWSNGLEHPTSSLDYLGFLEGLALASQPSSLGLFSA